MDSKLRQTFIFIIYVVMFHPANIIYTAMRINGAGLKSVFLSLKKTNRRLPNGLKMENAKRLGRITPIKRINLKIRIFANDKRILHK